MAVSEKDAQSPSAVFKGSCACARLTYQCSQVPESAQACHCVTCRKLSGGPYQPFTDVQSKSVTFFDRKEHFRYEGLPKDNIGGIIFLRFSPVGERAFCSSCYTPLAMRYKNEPEVIGLPLGTIDEDSIASEAVKNALKIQKHIFISQKAWWSDIGTDGIPTHERFTEGFEEALTAWQDKS